MADEITWPQFKHQHSGMDNEEISKLWKKYKEGRYFIGESNTPKKETKEFPRDEEEQEALDNLESPETTEEEDETTEEEEVVEETTEIEPQEDAESEEEPLQSLSKPPMTTQRKDSVTTPYMASRSSECLRLLQS
jgi:hypothetical protein